MSQVKSTEQSTIPPVQIALISLLGLVFLFCVVRTFMALRGPRAAAPQKSVAAAPNPPAAAAPQPEAAVEPTATPYESDTSLSETEIINPGAALIAGELPPDLALRVSVEVAPAEAPRVAVKPRPAVVAAATPTPTPTPEEQEAEAAPTPQGEPSATPPPDTVTVMGRLNRSGPNGPMPVRNHAVFLIDLSEAQTQQVSTDNEGRYTISNLKSGNLYYLVVTFEESLRIGHHYEYQYGGGQGGYGYGNVQVPTTVTEQISWHQAIIAPPPGAYGLDLDPSNADPEYCSDIQPTNDPVTRTPYRSWRRSALQPM